MLNKFIENDYSLNRKDKAANTHWIDRVMFKSDELSNNPIETYKREKARHREVLDMNQAERLNNISKDTLSHYGAEIAELAEQELAKAFDRQGFNCRIVKK